MATIRKQQLTDHIWLFDDKGDSTGYLVIGKEKALVIDTMNGSEDVKALAETITDLPLILVNTHCHPDHIGGNHFFDDVYLNERDLPLIDYFTRPEVKDKLPQVHFLKEGDIIDLGGLTVEVFELPGHTLGSILLLLREDRILFVGDAINHHLWMQLDDCYSIEKTLESFERLDFLKERADKILHGHTRDFDDISLMTQIENGFKELINQKGTEVSDKDPDYIWFGGTAKQHSFDKHGSVICYRVNNLKEV